MSVRKIKKILVSQPKPHSEKSPYYDIAEKYNVDKLVYFETTDSIESAIKREKQLKCDMMLSNHTKHIHKGVVFRD